MFQLPGAHNGRLEVAVPLPATLTTSERTLVANISPRKQERKGRVVFMAWILLLLLQQAADPDISQAFSHRTIGEPWPSLANKENRLSRRKQCLRSAEIRVSVFPHVSSPTPSPDLSLPRSPFAQVKAALWL